MKAYTVVIGAGYGDEGKGLVSFKISGEAQGRVLNVLYNGSAQRGHTVDFESGSRFVFRHVGAGAAAGADTYFDRDFMLNPLIFMEEQAELRGVLSAAPVCLADPQCRVTTVYDMIINQIVETARGKKRFGSCGCGVFETRRRYEQDSQALRYGELTALSREAFAQYMRGIRDGYLPRRLEELGVKAVDAQWKALLEDERLIACSWEDLQAMAQAVEIVPWPQAAARYDAIVFEAGQGLALDEGNMEDFPHLTPSHTTSQAPARRMLEAGAPFTAQLVYVTRSYVTRHGAGPLPGECPREAINPDMRDLTNVPNPFQETLRYAPLDVQAVRKRMLRDAQETARILGGRPRRVLALTHLNETGGRLAGGGTLAQLARGFDAVRLSSAPWRLEAEAPPAVDT